MFGNLDAGGKAQIYKTIKEAANEFNVTELCSVLGVSRSGYYAYLKRATVDKDVALKSLIQSIYQKYDGTYGYRQIQLFLLQDHGVRVNHKKVLRLMQAMNIRSRIRRKHRCNYASSAGERVAENLLKRQFKAEAPNQKWVTDVTQYRVSDTWLYLSAVKDLFNNEIVAPVAYRRQPCSLGSLFQCLQNGVLTSLDQLAWGLFCPSSPSALKLVVKRVVCQSI
ncbi:IS3 family transposase [Paenibacillus sp. NPDC056579]|uniref:IS3 family transposase n=1 Tax=Paenibacillus sp. NPDC056579 TaxID=3345871 RepID=UPI0036B9AA57